MDDEYARGVFNELISLNVLDSNKNTSFNPLFDESNPPPTITVEFILAEKHPCALIK